MNLKHKATLHLPKVSGPILKSDARLLTSEIITNDFQRPFWTRMTTRPFASLETKSSTFQAPRMTLNNFSMRWAQLPCSKSGSEGYRSSRSKNSSLKIKSALLWKAATRAGLRLKVKRSCSCFPPTRKCLWRTSGPEKSSTRTQYRCPKFAESQSTTTFLTSSGSKMRLQAITSTLLVF